MMHSRGRVGGLLLLGLLLASLLTPASAVPSKPRPENEQAAAALQHVQELLQRTSDRHRGHHRGTTDGVPGHAERRGLTMALRNLAVTKHELDTSDRRTAERLLARPSDSSETPYGEPKYGNREVRRSCSTQACVHWVETGEDATTVEFAQSVLSAATRSSQVMSGLGYRAPLRDGDQGGNARPDVYLANLGAYYGYAVPEGYHVRGGKRAAFGYMVLDNDYAEFCPNSCSGAAANRIMRATTAHEFFHLVQFGYDFHEASWFMEATATWIEDEVFDGVNDNVNFLGIAPNALQTPRAPLDAPDSNPYGNWIWFRHLSERLGPGVVRRAWQLADAWQGYQGNRNPKNLYSLLAVRRAVGDRGGRWNPSFAAFAGDNQWPRRYYDEGREQSYPSAPRAGTFWLTTDRRRAVREYRLSRLAAATHRIRPGRGLYRNWRLRVVIDGNTGARGGQALATVRRANGSVRRFGMPLGRNGRTARTLPFGQDEVRWVDITVVNASTRYRCWIGLEDTTCHGRSRDNRRLQQVVVKAVR